jgi:hypothetical protein
MKILNLIVLVLFLTGCSALEEKFVSPAPFYMCDKSETLLMCDSADLDNCWGYLEDKPIIIITEETEL